MSETAGTVHQGESRFAGALRPGRWWFGLFVGGLVLYSLTANRGAQWQDSGYHILRVVEGESVNPLGLALSHPLHHWLGRFAVRLGVFEPALAVTLVSGVAGAVAVANTLGCVTALTRSLPAGLFAAVALGVSHTHWQLSTLAETYTLTAALLSAELWCVVLYAQSRRDTWLCLAWFLNGLGLANHVLALLTIPVLAAVTMAGVRRRDSGPGAVAIGAGLWCLGSLPYTGLIALTMFRTGDVLGSLHSALFGEGYAEAVLNLWPTARQLLLGAGLTALNFPNLALPLAVYGLFRGGDAGGPALARRSLLAALVIHALFAVRYDIADQHTFFLPSFVLLGMFSGVGMARMLQGPAMPRRRRIVQIALISLAWTPLVYAGTPLVAHVPRVEGVLERFGWPAHRKPYRNDFVYAFVPWSVVERSAERMSREAVALAGEDGVIVTEDRMSLFAVRYQVLRQGYAGIEVVHDVSPEWLAEAASRRTVVLVPRWAEVPRLEPPAGAWRRVGDLYVLDASWVGGGGSP